MRQKPETANGYDYHVVENVKSACLYLATILGDLINDIVVVGGLVPYLMIEQKNKQGIIEKYVGTMDLDLGLSLGLLKKSRYREVSKRLRKANLKPDKNEQGNETFQRWIMTDSKDITVDFLINPSNITDQGGNLQNLEHDFAAVITPGLFLAFEDRLKVTIDGLTIRGERAKRDIYICGPGAYILLKALAFNNRGDNKDAYDLYYILRNFEEGIETIAGNIRSLLKYQKAEEAIKIVERDFNKIDSIGPIRVARFLKGYNDDIIQAEVVAFINRLLKLI